MRLQRPALLAIALFAGGCPGKPAELPKVVDAGAPAAGPATLKRPPHPNLATAAFGQRVLEERLTQLSSETKGTVPDALARLHEGAAGSEALMVTLALAAARDARTEAERGTALALAAAGLVLDPVVDGYKERLTDAHGLAAYAATLDQSNATGQAARALVKAAAGGVEQARQLVKAIEDNPAPGAVSADTRLLLALTRRIVGERGDRLVAGLREVAKDKPQSLRARALLAEQLLELGLTPEALEVAGNPPASPWLLAIAGRARVLSGEVDAGIAALREAEGKVDEGHRGDVLYWMARSLTQQPGTAAEVQGVASALSPRPGFSKESRVLESLLAQQAGDFARARTVLEPMVQGPPRQAVDLDALWLLMDACAGLGDRPCVDKAGALALHFDGDEGRLQVARAASVLVGKADGSLPQGVLDTFREAHRLTPFDDKLAAKVGDPVVSGGSAAAARVRAARRALARGDAEQLVVEALGAVKDPACRVCRALLVAGTADPQEAVRRGLKALDGAGPPLAESDLLRVIDALGGYALPEGKKALATLDGDSRPRVKQALAQARADLQDPAARAARNAPAGGDHGHTP